MDSSEEEYTFEDEEAIEDSLEDASNVSAKSKTKASLYDSYYRGSFIVDTDDDEDKTLDESSYTNKSEEHEDSFNNSSPRQSKNVNASVGDSIVGIAKKKTNVIQSDSENEQDDETNAFSKTATNIIQPDSENEDCAVEENIVSDEKSITNLVLKKLRSDNEDEHNDKSFIPQKKINSSDSNSELSLEPIIDSYVPTQGKSNLNNSESAEIHIQDDEKTHSLVQKSLVDNSMEKKFSDYNELIKNALKNSRNDEQGDEQLNTISNNDEMVLTSSGMNRKSILNHTAFNPQITPDMCSTILQNNSFSDSDDIIDISSDEESLEKPKRMLQTTIIDHFPRKPSVNEEPIVIENDLIDNSLTVDYETQKQIVSNLQAEVLKTKNALMTMNVAGLPDKGAQIIKHYDALRKKYEDEKDILSKIALTKMKDKSPEPVLKVGAPKVEMPVPKWEDLEAQVDFVQPKTFGKQALKTHNLQKALTMECLHEIHGCISTRPDENQVAKEPQYLKVELMQHQKHALAWLMWREKQKPSGGILGDDMGLGKTLTMISLMMKSREEEEENEEDEEVKENEAARRKQKYEGGTLIVCPASLISQWEGEVKKRVKKGIISLEVYHGPRREPKAKRLAKYDMVVTTYSIVQNEKGKDTPLFNIYWRRIILDEAHQIRNHKTNTSVAICELPGKSRWALSGTPVHNKELDLYALLKFLRCAPFDDLGVWKQWVSNKSTGGQDRLNTVISSLLLRRTKVQLMEKGSLQCLPERKWELITVTLNKKEMDVYQKVLIFSRNLFAQFLHQRAEKAHNKDEVDGIHEPNSEYYKMHKRLLKMNKVKEVKSHEILVLLLRLRQICCHLALITKMIEGNEDLEDIEDEHKDEMDLLDQINKLSLEDHPPDDQEHHLDINEPVPLAEATKGLLNPSNEIFQEATVSSKIKAILNVLEERVLISNDKAIIVSQWPGFLKIIASHLKQRGIKFTQLDGSIPVHKRNDIVEEINDSNRNTKVLLLSLTAGGVGLNLVGANHLLLVDLHWNPQLESQAQDRIYRMGQTKMVHVYKFMATDTIEQRIKNLQDKKLELAENMLTGAKVRSSKLSMDDLKLLFNM